MAKDTKTKDETKDTQSLPEIKLKEYTKEDLIKVFDDLIFNNEYEEEFLIKGKLKVIFRSRNTEEAMAVSDQLDKSEFKLITTMQERRAFMNISRSLVSYQGRDLKQMTLDDREKFVKKLSLPVIGAISDVLTEFDRKVDLACREGNEGF